MKQFEQDKLSLHQLHLIDEIREQESPDELYAWIDSLPTNVRRDAVSLMMLIAIEFLEEDLQELDNFNEAKQVLKKFRL